MSKLKRSFLNEVPELKVLGRTTKELNPLTIFWTGSGIELNIRASQLWLEVEADYSEYEPWICVLINGVFVSRQMLYRGTQKLCIFRGMNKEKVKQVKVLRDTQAMSDDAQCLVQFKSIETDGTFEKVQDARLKLEIIGDSITSGEGAYGAKEEDDWIPMFFSATNNYAYLLAEKLKAEYRTISQSGWGILTSWDNNPNHALPKYYTQVCGLLQGERNKLLGAQSTYDFKNWEPDIVIVNLGTNDSSAFNQPPWVDPKTGKSYKQHILEDGTRSTEDVECLKEATINFLKKIRKCNLKAYILWAYGMLGNEMQPIINEAIKCYQYETGDKKIQFVQLPETTEENLGARRHPGIKSHQLAADILYKVINSLKF